jgi:hypothetical protein
MNMTLLSLEVVICLPVTGVIGVVVGLLAGFLQQRDKDAKLRRSSMVRGAIVGLVTGTIIGLAICVFFALGNPCGGFIGC